MAETPVEAYQRGVDELDEFLSNSDVSAEAETGLQALTQAFFKLAEKNQVDGLALIIIEYNKLWAEYRAGAIEDGSEEEDGN